MLNAEPVTVGYLGPEGSFAHLIAQQHFAKDSRFVACASVPEVFEFVEADRSRLGVVPIENSSGGTIIPTVDALIEHACSVYIQEEISIDVKLALLAKKGSGLTTIYSHFAPLQHCERWLKKQYPQARPQVTVSTSSAALLATQEAGSAAIGPIGNAELYGLEVLEYPIEEAIPNVTQFVVIGNERDVAPEPRKTSLIIALRNYPGSLCDFLIPFKNFAVSLTRIESRPIIGKPNTYRFYVEIDGVENDPAVARAFQAAREITESFDDLGKYPVGPRYRC